MEKLENYITKEEKNIIEYCFGAQGSYNVHYDLSICNKYESGKVYIDNIKVNDTELAKIIPTIEIKKNQEIYISKNPIKKSIITDRMMKQTKESGLTGSIYETKKYKKELTDSDVFSFRNIVIHLNKPIPKERLIIAIKNSVTRGYMLIPTVVYKTAKGYDIYYSLKETNKLYEKDYLAAGEVLQASVAMMCIKELNISLFYSILDNSYAEAVKLFIKSEDNEIIEFNKYKYEINDILRLDKTKKPHQEGSVQDIIKKVQVMPIKDIKRMPLSVRRLDIIEDLYYKKNMELSIEDEINYCFLYYNNIVQIYDLNSAKNKLYTFNKKLKEPLVEERLIEIIKAVSGTEDGYYKYTNESFAKQLKLTAKEIKKYKLNNESLSRRKRHIREIIRHYKLIRNRKIIETYASTGDIKKSASAGHCCTNTVRKILNSATGLILYIRRRKIAARDRKVFNNYINHISEKKAAIAGKCSLPTVKKIIEKYNKIRTYIAEQIENNNIYIPDIYSYMKASHHNKFYKSEYKKIEDIIAYSTELSRYDIHIAVAPYIVLD